MFWDNCPQEEQITHVTYKDKLYSESSVPLRLPADSTCTFNMPFALLCSALIRIAEWKKRNHALKQACAALAGDIQQHTSQTNDLLPKIGVFSMVFRTQDRLHGRRHGIAAPATG